MRRPLHGCDPSRAVVVAWLLFKALPAALWIAFGVFVWWANRGPPF